MARENVPVHAELLAVADDWAEAIVANDADRIARFVTDEWVVFSASGASQGERFLELVRSGALTHSAMDRVGEARVRVYGDTGVVTARVTNVAHYRGRRIEADEWTTDVFVRRNGRWRCVLSHLTSAESGIAE